MNRKAFTVFFLMAVLAIFGLGSCFSSKGPDEIENAKNYLDWEGVYAGTILLGNGHIADISIKLNRDQSFEYNCKYLDNDYDPYPLNFIAPFRWDDTGNIIMMDPIDAPVQYKVEKDKLIRLDEDNYILMKIR